MSSPLWARDEIGYVKTVTFGGSTLTIRKVGEGHYRKSYSIKVLSGGLPAPINLIDMCWESSWPGGDAPLPHAPFGGSVDVIGTDGAVVQVYQD